MVDTLRYTKKLKASGIDSAHAESIVYTQKDMILKNVATKESLKMTEVALRSDMKGLRSEMKGLAAELRSEMKNLKSDILIKLGGGLIIGFGLTISSIGVMGWLIGAG